MRSQAGGMPSLENVAVIAAPMSVRPTTSAAVDVAVVAVTYNSAAIILPFLTAMPDALEDIGTSEVIVVDNDSSDETVALIRTVAPWVTVIESGGNVGYGAGLNIGILHSVAQRGVLVMNPDAVPAPRCASRLLEAVEESGDVGIAVPRMVDAEGRLSYSLRREPTILRALGEAVLGGSRAARFPVLGETIRDSGHYVDGAGADWATGAAMLISCRAMSAAGLWAEDFFLYSEETDYALRVRDVGLKLRFAADAVVAHEGGELQRSPWLWSLQAVNRVRLYRRRHGRIAGGVYWCAVALNEALRAVRPRPTHRAALRALVSGHEALNGKRAPAP